MQSITQIPGVLAAHATNEEGGTGCTVLVFPQGAVGAVDVRGGAPATRETDLLRPEETVQVLHSVVLSGGSAYGLAASCGVAEELERAGMGINVGVGVVPIVSSACLFDLVVGDPYARPTAADGAAATRAALAQQDVPATERKPLAQGNVGAGTGCSVGKLCGPWRSMKAGLGESVQVAGDVVCGAVAAVNALGGVVDPQTGQPIAGLLSRDGSGIVDVVDTALGFIDGTVEDDPDGLSWLRANTTISCVVTNAKLTKAQATKVAQMSADAYAHTIRPVHTTNDGDTVFVACTGEVDCHVDVVGMLATRALEQAIANAAYNAEAAYGLKAARDFK
ncbi:MAG: P1 family peptidase [Coriobacteriales bacterium]|nr:P1 family peptidase [Coriobacteriales bacterium]